MAYHKRRNYQKKYKKKYKPYKYGSYKKKKYHQSSNNSVGVVIAAIIILVGIISVFGASIQQLQKVVFISLIVVAPFVLLTGFIIAYRIRRKREMSNITRTVLEDLRRMDPFEFEKFVSWIFEKLGYNSVVTKQSGDHGIDLRMKKDGVHYVAQVKRYSEKNWVGEPELRDFYGSFAGTQISRGFFITSGYYSIPAKDWVKDKPIEIINGEELIEIIQKFEQSKWHQLLFK